MLVNLSGFIINVAQRLTHFVLL